MMTKWLAPDPKGKLIISSLLTLQHLLHSLDCTRNAMSYVLLLPMMVLVYVCVCVAGGFDFCQGMWCLLQSFFLVHLYFVLSCFQSLYLDGQRMMAVVLLLCFCFTCHVSGSFNQELLLHVDCCLLFHIKRKQIINKATHTTAIMLKQRI